jgi:acetyl-CoA acyltransferase 1
MSLNPMHKLYEDHPPEVDWDAIGKCRHSDDAMDCLIPMGVTSENVSREYRLDRATLDEFAARSHRRAARAQSLGKFKSEIVPVGGIDQDDGIRPTTTADKLAKLTPVFDKENGSTTAGNSSQLTDGAAAVLLMSREEAVRRHLPIMGVFRSFAVEGVPPKVMGIGPVYAIPSALEKASLSVDDIDVYEINEAFASQAHYSVQTLKLDPSKVNPNGGAIALGHPLGCTGARLVVSLLHEMRRENKKRGVVSMCIGTGMGAAAVFEVDGVRSSL